MPRIDTHHHLIPPDYRKALHHHDDALAQTFRTLDPSEFPATVAVADHLPVPWEDEFAFGLDLIVEGLAQALRSAQSRGG